MAVNKPYDDNHRNGAVRNRIQYLNPVNERWIKINTETNRIIDVKSDKTPFKGVRKGSK